MLVKLGNSKPHSQGVPVDGPAVTTVSVRDDKNEDGSYVAGYVVGSDAAEVKDHLYDNPGPVSHLPGNGGLVSIIKSWPDHGNERPTWVHVTPEGRDAAEAEDLERFLADFWHADRGVPADVQATHYTASGAPGEG